MTGDLDSAFQAVLAGDGDDPLIEYGGDWVQRAAVRAVAEAVERALAEAGIAADAPVGLIARNRPQHVSALFGLLARRRTVVMLHAYQTPQGLADEIARLRLAVIVGDPQDVSDTALYAARQVGTLVLAFEPMAAPGVTVRAPASAGPHHAAEPDVAIRMLTSGTTGTPKRVPIPYAMLEDAVADAGLATAQAGTAFTSAPYIQFYPLGNISGLYGLITCAANGQRIVLIEKFSVEEWVRAVETYRPTTFVSLPPAALRMVMDADVPAAALSSIPAMRCGSAPLDPELQRRFEARYGIPILINYGATEFCGVIANWTIDLHRRFSAEKRGSVGQARPGVSLRVVDPDTGADCAVGTQGQLEVLAPRVSKAWVRTTDLAIIDADGFLYLKGRADSMIIRGGFKVSPDAVADVLRKHPAVLEAAVVGLPDTRLGEVPVAAIELKEDADVPTPGDLEAFARERLSAQMIPVRFHILPALPRTQSMKVDRGVLRSVLAQA